MNKELFRHNYVPTWEVLPAATKKIAEQRNALEKASDISKLDKQNVVLGLNYSIILNSACMIEGCLDLFLKVAVKILLQDRESSDIERTLIQNFMAEISAATWSKYNSIFEKVTGEKLFNIFTGEHQGLKNDIDFLFKYRNILAHGESIGMNYGEVFPEVLFEARAEEVKNSLQKKQLGMDSIENGTPYMETFLTSKVADFFFSRSKEFIYVLSDNVRLKPNPILNKERIKKIFETEETEGES